MNRDSQYNRLFILILTFTLSVSFFSGRALAIEPNAYGEGFIWGVVKNSFTGEPIENVRTSTDYGISTTSLPNGGYMMVHPAGTYSVTAEATGYYSESSNVEVTDSEATDRNFTLTPITTTTTSPTTTTSTTSTSTTSTTTTTLPGFPTAITGAATVHSSNSATLNGTVNPNGISTIYFFEYGTTTNYGAFTGLRSAGAGWTDVSVAVYIASLAHSTTYHFRVVAANSVGTTDGSDKSFLTYAPAGLPTVTTTTVSLMTSTSASSGGNVTSDGGTSITARGVCWSTSANPTISNSHTTDGSGTGSFTSSITGLSPSTIYHVRAYATNGAGTAYGSDRSFSTSEQSHLLAGSIGGLVSDIESGSPIRSAEVSTDGGGTATSLSNGAYLMLHNPGIFSVTADATGYTQTTYTSVTVIELGSNTLDFKLATTTPTTASTTLPTTGSTTTLPPSACPDCSGSPVVLTGITFESGTACECSDSVSITIGTGVTIKSGANITFKAPTVKIRSGFHAEAGATVNIKQQ